MRRQGLVLLLAVLSLAGFFGFLVGETRLEKALEQKASTVLGTAVEIDNLQVYLPRPGISFDSLRIVDPYEPKTNLVHTGRVAFFLDTSALLENKFVVHDLAINDIRIGTARTQAAKIIETRHTWPAWLRRAEAYLHKQILLPPRLDSDPTKTNLESLLPLLELPFSSKIEQLSLHADSSYQKWQRRLGKIAEIVSQIKTPERRTEMDSESRKSAIKETRRIISTFRKELEIGVESLSASLSSIEMLDSLKLDEAEGNERLIRVNDQVIAQAVFGRALHQVTMRLLRLLSIVRQYMPTSSVFDPVGVSIKKAAHSGLNIRYGVDGSQPSFLIERIFVQSDSSRIPTRKIKRTEGKISGITSDPQIFGAPLTFNINPIFSDPRSLSFHGTIDNIGEIPRTRLEYDGAGFNQRDLNLPRRSYLPSKIIFKRGTTDGLMEVVGDSIQLFLSFYVNPVTFDFRHSADGSALMNSVRKRLDSQTRFSLFCEVSGTLDKPEMYVESSIDKIIADVIQEPILERISSDRSEFQEKIGELLEARKNEMQCRIFSQKRQVMSELARHERAVEQATNSLRARAE
ncbi:hypothetical protein MJD09_11140 [bacterium]|nr:hypothetical protein [bacterium]